MIHVSRDQSLILDLSRSLDRDEPGQAGIVPLSQVNLTLQFFMYLKFLKKRPTHLSLYFMNNTWPRLKYEPDVKSVAAVDGDGKDFNRKSTQKNSFRRAFI